MLHHPTLRELFLAFLQIGVSSFGGALPWARHVLLDQRKWLDDKAFTEMLTISQTMPGPNIVNVATYYGAYHRGVLGAAATCIGLLAVPMCIVLALSMIYLKFAHLAPVKGAILGMTATAFMYSQAVKLSKPFSKNKIAVAMALATFLIGIALHWPMPLVLFTCGAVSIALAFKGRI
jgi:chromate transporter